MSDIQITISTTDANSAVVIQRVTDTVKKLGTETKNTAAEQKKAGETWKEYTTGINQGLEILSKATTVIKSVYAVAKEGADLQEAKEGWRNYATAVGVSIDAVLVASRKAVSGQVSDAELVTRTYAAMKQGVSRDTGEIAALWQIAEAKSDEFGGSVSDNFKTITEAITSGNSKSLISLGLLPESFGRAKDAADLLERRTSILNDVLTQFGSTGGDAGTASLSAADSFNRFETSVTNLKDGVASLAPALQPAIDKLTELTEKLAAYLRARGILDKQNPYMGLSSDDTRSKLEMAQESLQSLSRPGIPGVSEETRLANMDTLSAEVKMLQQALKANKELEDGLRNADLWQEGDERIAALAKAHEKAGKGAKDHAKAVKDLSANHVALSKAMHDAFEEMQKYASVDDLEQMGMTFADLARQAESFIDALGMSRLEPVRGMLIDLAQAAGMLSGNLQKAGAWISGGAQGTVAAAQGWIKGDVLGERYSGTLYDMATGLWQNSKTSSAESMFGGIENFAKTFWNALSKPSDKGQAEDALRAVLEKPLARVFNDAMVQGLEEGNFFSALEKGFKRIVYQNISDAMTIAFFGGSSSAKSGINGATSSTGGGGLLSGLTNGGNIWRDGKLQTGNLTQMLGTNLALGLVTSRLFGDGGLFGGSVIHGQEAINQAADINTQVKQASDQKNIVAGQIGISDATFEKLQNLMFYNAGYTWDKSGNGITSKKTTTYALDASAAQASLAEYGKLVAQASAEAAAREYEKSFAAITSPTKALEMTIEDLNAVVKRQTDVNGKVYTDTGKQALLQLEQLKAQLANNAITRAGDWFSFALSNPFASNTVAQTGFFDDGETLGDYAIDRYKYPRVPDPKTALTVGGNSLYGADITTYLDQRAMMAGLKDQYTNAYDMYAMSVDPTQKENYLTARAEQLNEQMVTAKKLADLAEAKVKDLTLSMEARAQAFQEFHQAEAEYYANKQKALDVELQKKQAIKDKQDALKNDKISDALTFLGEIREKGGQTIMILNAGSPDTVDRLKQIRDGLDSEGAAVIQQVIERFGGSANPALRL